MRERRTAEAVRILPLALGGLVHAVPLAHLNSQARYSTPFSACLEYLPPLSTFSTCLLTLTRPVHAVPLTHLADPNPNPNPNPNPHPNPNPNPSPNPNPNPNPQPALADARPMSVTSRPEGVSAAFTWIARSFQPHLERG